MVPIQNVPQPIVTENNNHRKPETPRQVKARVKKKQAVVNEALKKQSDQVSGKRYQNLKHMDPTLFNSAAEMKFIELVRGMIEENQGNPVNIAEIYRETSYELNVSTETVKRYLFKHSARRAELRVFGKAVMLNPNYQPAEETEDEN
jgi:hypothetical protein